MQHHPIHYNFGTRYIHRELPAEVVRDLVDLHFVKDENDLAGKVRRAERWFRDTIAAVRFSIHGG
jgi:hypothetical protein